MRSLSLRLLFASALLCLCCAGFSQEAQQVVLGIATHEAAKYNTEYLKFDRMPPVYRQSGIEASLVEMDGLYLQDWSEEQIVSLLRRYHVILLNTTCEGLPRLTPELEARARRVGAALARYVGEGGGLYLQPRSVRYPGDEDERYWNLVLEPLGCEILHEGVFDKTRQYEGRTAGKALFWYTSAASQHPVTAGVRCLYLPLHDYFDGPGVPAMRYSEDWEVVVRGEAEAGSFRSGLPNDPNTINLEAPGTYAQSPPVVAVRALGKGRIVSYPLSPLFTGLNHGNPQWTETVETAGDPLSGRPSDSLKLQMNACRWLAERVMADPEFGTYRPEPYAPVTFPERKDWDKEQFAPIPGVKLADGKPVLDGGTTGVRAVVGLHSAYSDGEGTVAQYVQAARAAGVSIVVFTDPLEKLTAETLDKLKADCAAASVGEDFYACPGVEFTDGSGTRWAMWGERVVFPEPGFSDPYVASRKYKLWDGERLRSYGQYAANCGFSPSAILDYKQFRANGSHPENLWWFYNYLPLVYDHGRQVADNYGEFLFGLRDLRWCAVNSFTRITSPGELAGAVGTMFTGYRDMKTAREVLNSRCAPYWSAWAACQYASQGPQVLQWEAINSQMEEDWRYTRGAQRVRCRFVVRSDAPIREVLVHDADRGVFRRFLGDGEKLLVREFEMVHDQQHYLTLEVIDEAGKRAFSHYLLIYCYKQGLFRCGDNLNILGATNMIWHPDRNQLFPIGKSFHNGEDYTLEGWDRGQAMCPMPGGWMENFAYIKGVGPYPHPETHNVMTGALMDVGLSSYNVQIASLKMDYLAERFDTEQRPTPSSAGVVRDLGENEYFSRTHTIYAPEDREDYYVIWNNRRRREGMQDYRGGVIWHEGEIRFRRDVTLGGSSVPISLLFFDIPHDVEHGWGHSVLITDADGTTKVAMLRPGDKATHGGGRLRAGGYAAQMPALVGHRAFYAPPGSDFCYSYSLPGRLYIGLGSEGQEIKAGTVIPYRFAVVTFATDKAGNTELEDQLEAYNLAGGTSGYPNQVGTGTLEDATFFCRLQAQDREVALSVGPRKLVVDLPFRVRGLEDNGCAAVYSSRRPWFRFVPVYEGAAVFQESIETANDLWVGNVFTCDSADVKVTLIVDGQTEGQAAVLELHNPTDAALSTTVRSPAGAPQFGGLGQEVSLPAGATTRFRIEGKSLAKVSGDGL